MGYHLFSLYSYQGQASSGKPEAKSNPRTPSISIPKNALTPFSESGYGASNFGISPGTFSKQDSSVVQPASNGYSSGIDTSYSKDLPTYFDVNDIEEKFLRHWKDIEDEIDPLAIIDQLLAKFVLSFDEHENIKNIDFKPDKMLCLCEYVLRKQWKASGVFCQTLKEEPIYSHIADKLISEHRGRKTPKGYGVSEITYDLGSKELEMMIVEDYSDDDEHLHAEAMDLGFEVEEVKFPSINIKLSSLSCQSQAEFLRRLKESNEFVGKILKAVLKKKHLKKLREAKVSKIPFRLTLQWPKPDQVKCLCILKKSTLLNTLQR
ncbi:uncharacterized protein LOC128213080 isoform X2 [Mya arenaria]|uniref:uncharacterized protein LOC128213080 isoform X2 n=1 Tax=Mya arenaria TaxID=6604 RepID=UPI0022E6A197|nr:uncharacterized protein LOC128213080 isoform X2 [Mya arenaria]